MMSNLSKIKYRVHPVYTNYSVGDDGSVWNMTNGKRFFEIRSRVNNAGYARVGLRINGKTKELLVHRLVAECFIDNPLEKPLVNHIDLNKMNNTVDNLEWCTHVENVNHYIKNRA